MNRVKLGLVCTSDTAIHVCQIYDKSGQITSIQEVRCSQFLKTRKSFKNMHPTEDALICHLKRAHYQTKKMAGVTQYIF